MIGLLALYGLVSAGCSTDPIKAVKNDPDRMEIMMNHIANDPEFQGKMVDTLLKKGDRQKLAEKFAADEDVSRNLVSKIFENPKGEEDIESRVGNRKEYLIKALEKAMQMPENREIILTTLLANKDMVEFLKTSTALQDALSGTTAIGETTTGIPDEKAMAEKKQPVEKPKSPTK